MEEAVETFKLNVVLETLSKEKHIDKEILVDALKSAMLTAARRKLGLTADLEARFDPDATMEEVLKRHGQFAVLNKMKEPDKREAVGLVRIYEFKKVVKDVHNPSIEISLDEARKEDPGLTDEDIGIDLGVEVWSKEFGRIAAQTAKQVIIQRVREAERNTVFNNYKDRKGELVTGNLRRMERGNMIIDLGSVEAVMPLKEQVPRENIRIGERVVAYVLDVLEVARGPQVVLSRTHPNVVVKLFEQEVPEIADGVVSVEAAAREAGVRTKIAVRSRDSDVDPVGACVGMKGSRVQAVVQELRGEKIDITSETKVAEERDVAWASLSRIEGISDFVVQTLYNHGFRRAQDVVDIDDEYLASLPGFSADAVPRVKTSAKDVVKAEANEKKEERNRAREAARILLAVERACEKERADGKADKDRLLGLEGVRPYVIERLAAGFYEAPEDLFFEEDVERLVGISGFSPGKARQLKFAAANYVHDLTKGAVPLNEKPLSEPELRDANQYDQLNAGEGAGA